MNEELQEPAAGEVDEGLTIRGDLQESGVPELLKSLTQNRETGILTLTSDGVDKSIHLKEGRILFAASTDPDDRLGEILLRTGKITLDHYFESAQHIRPGKRQGSVLVELGAITPDDLVRGVFEQVAWIVHSLFHWIQGEYKMVLKDLDTHDLITLNISTPSLIFEGVRGVRAWSRIWQGLGGSLDSTFCHAEDADKIIYDMDLGEDESHIYGLTTGRLTVHQICSMSYLSNFDTCSALWGFLCIGAIEATAGEGGAEADGSKPDTSAPAASYEGVLDRFVAAFAQLRADIEEESPDAWPDFLDAALRQVREHHPDALDGVGTAGELRDSLAAAARAMGEDAGARLESALQDLLYALLLLVKVRKGPEAESRISTKISAILHPGDG